jgi:hypothetical protein
VLLLPELASWLLELDELLEVLEVLELDDPELVVVLVVEVP